MSRTVIEYGGRFAIAHWSEASGQYHAPMTPEGKRLTGCYAVFGRTEKSIVTDLNVRTFATREAAVAELARQLGDGE